MDYSLYQAINGLAGHSASADGVFRAAATYLPVVAISFVALLFLFPWQNRRLARRTGAVSGTAAAALALLISQPLAHAVHRMRPYLAHPAHAHLLITRSHDPSFPSDHAVGAFAIAIAVWFYDRTAGAVLLSLALLLALARVLVGTHYPGDVAGGALIGILFGVGVYWPPVRHFLGRVTEVCSSVWDRISRPLTPTP